MFFFFNDTATTEIYTLSLHDALPISVLGTPMQQDRWPELQKPSGCSRRSIPKAAARSERDRRPSSHAERGQASRSEEHTSELQSRLHLVCRLLLEKKKMIGESEYAVG